MIALLQRSILYMVSSALLVLLGAACISTPKTPAKKPHDFCYCGAMNNAANQPFCAIWENRERFDLPHKVIAAEAQATCTPEDCSKLFSPYCQRMQMWAYQPAQYPEPSKSPCYCDSTLIENDKGQISLVCAAWIDGHKQMLEYYATKECKPETCAQDPFHIAPKLCPQDFRPFYQRPKTP